MTFKLYAQFDNILSRTGPTFKNPDKAKAAAGKLPNPTVEVRQVMPTGRETLYTIFKDGVEVAAMSMAPTPMQTLASAYAEISQSLKSITNYADEAIARATSEPATPILKKEAA